MKVGTKVLIRGDNGKFDPAQPGGIVIGARKGARVVKYFDREWNKEVTGVFNICELTRDVR